MIERRKNPSPLTEEVFYKLTEDEQLVLGWIGTSGKSNNRITREDLIGALVGEAPTQLKSYELASVLNSLYIKGFLEMDIPLDLKKPIRYSIRPVDSMFFTEQLESLPEEE